MNIDRGIQSGFRSLIVGALAAVIAKRTDRLAYAIGQAVQDGVRGLSKVPHVAPPKSHPNPHLMQNTLAMI